MSCLSISHLTKKFINEKKEHLVLDDISFDVTSGEFVCILGHSGCGKTTMLRILSGFESLTSRRSYLQWRQSNETTNEICNGISRF